VSTNYVIEDGVYGNRLVVTGPWFDDLAALMRRRGIEELYLNYARGWKGNLAFLPSLPWLKAFTILDWNIEDVSPIHSLTELRMLEVSAYYNTEIRFPGFQSLEDCRLQWRDGAHSLFQCKGLLNLFVSDYSHRSSEPFGNLRLLRSLTIAGGPLNNLRGLGSLVMLEFLGLHELGRLKSLAGIENLLALKTLEISGCRAIKRIDEVGQLKNLRRFQLTDGGEIDSIKPLASLNDLREILLYGSTNVADGDMSSLLQLPVLEKVSYKNRAHYTHTRESLRLSSGRSA
jgi:Leucine-rich repeat (LRR) protein